MQDSEELTSGVELVETKHEQVAPLVASKLSDDGALNGDDDNDDDHLAPPPRAPTGTASNAQVAVNIVISFVGAGLLGIPRAFSRAGWLLGSVTLCSVSALNIYAMMLLPKVRKRLQQQVHDHKDEDSPYDYNTYGGIGRILMGKRGEFVVNLCLLISQVGFATAYIIFIADSLESRAARWKVCFGCVPGLALLVQAPDMRSLSPFSLLANCANLIGLSAVLWQDVETLEETTTVFDDPIHAIKWSGMVNVMAVTLYSMEGVGLILSLETSCRNTADFPWLLTRVVGSITLFMSLFGSVSYAAFGSDTQAPITLNLGCSKAATVVQGALCCALYLTYPVMMFPVWTIAEEQLLHTENTNPALKSLLRCGIVVTTAFVAFSVPDFGDYLSLVGSSICNILGFLLPCYFNLCVFGKELSNTVRVFNYCLIGCAVAFGLMGTWQSFVNLMNPDEAGDTQHC